MSNYQCPHANPGCSRSALCGACGGGMIGDGERVRVALPLMDSLQRSVAANTSQPSRPVSEAERRIARADAYADHYREQRAKRQAAIAADPVAKAYYAQFEPRRRG